MRSLRISEAHKRLMRSVRFGQKQLGIEWTTMPPALARGGRRDYPNDQEEGWFSDLIDDRLVNNVGSDPGCIEIPSQVLRSWGQVIQFYSTVMKRAAQFDCVQDSEKSTGGGGHIHISSQAWYDYSSITDERTDVLQAYVTNRPWIAWALNDYSDNITAVCGEHDGIRTSPAVRNSFDNVEFRFFDSARNIGEQIEHVAFALRLISVKAPNMGIPRRIPRMSLTKALKGWHDTITEFGLPWNLYRKYADNIRARYDLGWRYLN